MLSVNVIYVGDTKEDYFAEAEKEYLKRMQPFCVYKSINIKGEKLPENEDNKILVEKALKIEADKIRAKLPKRCCKIALCVEGKSLTSESFARFIEEKRQEYSELVFLVGSSHGLDKALKKECDFLLSVSAMTFPHRLMRPIIAEQVYRAYTILTGKKYHK